MKYMRQLTVIIGVTFLGEVVRHYVPLPVPAGIYGLVFMFIFLLTGIIKIDQVKETADFLIEIMILMFIPGAVGLLDNLEFLKPLLIPIAVMILVSTSLVIGVTGQTAQLLLKKKGGIKSE